MFSQVSVYPVGRQGSPPSRTGQGVPPPQARHAVRALLHLIPLPMSNDMGKKLLEKVCACPPPPPQGKTGGNPRQPSCFWTGQGGTHLLSPLSPRQDGGFCCNLNSLFSRFLNCNIVGILPSGHLRAFFFQLGKERFQLTSMFLKSSFTISTACKKRVFPAFSTFSLYLFFCGGY